ncbi:hypothetical protein SEA_EJIMIX_219 [Mycobacterium phage Ejimix]|nr:hypothetical protein SEA_EJIMIX_219 [Mycobacterium phage Ejimix]
MNNNALVERARRAMNDPKASQAMPELLSALHSLNYRVRELESNKCSCRQSSR